MARISETEFPSKLMILFLVLIVIGPASFQIRLEGYRVRTYKWILAARLAHLTRPNRLGQDAIPIALPRQRSEQLNSVSDSLDE